MYHLVFPILLLAVLSSCSAPSDAVRTPENSQEEQETINLPDGSSSKVDVAPKAPSSETPYLAAFKDADVALPEPVGSGVFSIVDGCVILTTGGSEDSVYTPVFGKGTSIKYENGVPKAILDSNGKTIPLGVKINVPGAGIGTDHSQYLSGSLPSFCPRKLFGVGG
jgi:hypothetical protein